MDIVKAFFQDMFAYLEPRGVPSRSPSPAPPSPSTYHTAQTTPIASNVPGPSQKRKRNNGEDGDDSAIHRTHTSRGAFIARMNRARLLEYREELETTLRAFVSAEIAALQRDRDLASTKLATALDELATTYAQRDEARTQRDDARVRIWHLQNEMADLRRMAGDSETRVKRVELFVEQLRQERDDAVRERDEARAAVDEEALRREEEVTDAELAREQTVKERDEAKAELDKAFAAGVERGRREAELAQFADLYTSDDDDNDDDESLDEGDVEVHDEALGCTGGMNIDHKPLSGPGEREAKEAPRSRQQVLHENDSDEEDEVS